MSSLPEEIIEENILTRLPVKSISRFRCVSKNWHLLFRNPNFIKNHLNHANLTNNFNILVVCHHGVTRNRNFHSECSSLYSIDFLSSTTSPFVGHAFKIDHPFMSLGCMPLIRGSCNGLVCIEPSPRNICIWNPATREYKRLPDAPIGYPSAKAQESAQSFAYGFGFDSRNDDYKVLRIVSFIEVGVSEARVYSLASDSWKELGFVPCSLCSSPDDGIFLNAVLHWVATVRRNGLKSNVTVLYDISDETFSDVPLPNSYSNGHVLLVHLGIWEGNLCLLQINQHVHIDVWTMKDNKWIKHLEINAHATGLFYQRPFQTLQSGEILFEGAPTEEDGISLRAYNPNLERARALKIHGLPDKCIPLVNKTYVETLLPLNSGTYVERINI